MTNRYLRVLVVIVGAALVVSGIAPYDRTTWWLEIFPILIGTPILVATYRRFPLTKLTYTLLAIHALILVVGGHRSEEHTSELQSQSNLVCRLLLEKKKKNS